jgi:beta-phosphoglucomutase-like phosphatase (HAD superfamily)
VTLDTVAAHWRVALFAAEDFLGTARSAGRSLGLGEDEIARFGRELAEEEAATQRLLDAVAHEQGVQLQHRLSAPRATKATLGLPVDVEACLFDLDGLLSGSPAMHAAAWRETFDGFLSGRLERTGERFAPFRPFHTRDYYRYLHGKPRLIGAQAFLASRGIRLPEGEPGDPVDAETVCGLGNRKNQILRRRLAYEGVEAFAGSLHYLEAAREAGVRCAVLSPSANSEAMIRRAGLGSLVSCVVDGDLVQREGLEGRPAPDMIVAACRVLGVEPRDVASFETTAPGLASAHAARVAAIVGVGRATEAVALHAHGAEIVVSDLGDLLDPAIR